MVKRVLCFAMAAAGAWPCVLALTLPSLQAKSRPGRCDGSTTTAPPGIDKGALGAGHASAAAATVAAAAATNGRRACLAGLAGTWFAAVISGGGGGAPVQAALAAGSADCFTDCDLNCRRVAPSSGSYCAATCQEYCAQGDRRDGLSGAVSSEAAEVGWASYFDLRARAAGQTKGVVYGSDKPPDLGLGGLADKFGVRDLAARKR